MSDGRLIGEVVLLQIHSDLLVPGDSFDPKPLIEVDALSIDQAGVVGWVGNSWALDVHHRSWPGQGGRRPVSIGFTSHYDKMRKRFRDIPLGTAGENIIVSADATVALGDLGTRVALRSADGRETMLTKPLVARPCRQFTSFLLELPYKAERQEIADELEFLDGGTRGFIFSVDGLEEPGRVERGDRLYAF